MKRSELFFTALLIPVDILMVGLAFFAAYSFRGALAPYSIYYPTVQYLKIIIWISPFWVLFFAFLGLYSPLSTRSLSKELKKVIVGVTAGTMAVLAVGYLFPNPLINLNLPQPLFPAKSIPLLAWVLGVITVAGGRGAVYGVQKFLFKKDIGRHLAVLVGTSGTGKSILEETMNSPALGYRIVATVGKKNKQIRDIINFDEFEELESAFEQIGHVDELIVADPSLSPVKILHMLNFANAHQLDFKYIPSIFSLAAAHSEFGTIGATPVVEVQRTPLSGWGRIFKRIFDITLSGIALLMALPFLLMVALFVKTSEGPIFFAHERVGKAGKKIRVFKFRTMVRDAELMLKLALARDPELAREWKSSFKLKNDPRVTHIGKLLRKTSIDELPQLFNVLLGEMSLVGPRPITEGELDKYGEHKNVLLALKPGLTGLWQSSGRSDLSYEERVKLDLLYVENWSPWLDIQILFKTVLRLFKGAY